MGRQSIGNQLTDESDSSLQQVGVLSLSPLTAGYISAVPLWYGYTRGYRHGHVTGLNYMNESKKPASLTPRITAWNTDITGKKNLMFIVSRTSVGSDLFSSSADVVVINRNSQGTLGAALAEIMPLTLADF